MSAGHTHGSASEAHERALWLALLLTGTFLAAEVLAGLAFNSLALLSDAAHMFTDTAGLAIALLAMRVGRREPDARRTYGYQRLEILAAGLNAVMLLAAGAYVLVEGYKRFFEPAQVQTWGMLVVAVLGLIVNFASLRMLESGKDQSLNLKGAYMEVWADMVGSIGVIGAALVIKFTGWNWVDPVVAIAIGIWVVPRTWVLLKATLNVLLEGAPSDIDLPKLRSALLAIPGVQDVHDLHVWTLSSGKHSMTAHVVHTPQINTPELLRQLQHLMENDFGVRHTTFQLELEACRVSDADLNAQVSTTQGHRH